MPRRSIDSENSGDHKGQERNEPNEGHNENNGRNYDPRPFIQPDLFLMLKEFALPLTIVQSAERHANCSILRLTK